jgi:replication factor C subunit 1
MDKAATSLSDSDLVDALIHGPEQHWTLMPFHAVTSTVRPASFLYGNGGGFNGPNAVSFPQSVSFIPPRNLTHPPFVVIAVTRWLGQNSKQNKLARQLGDIQIRMRLKVSGDKPEIRQSYIPALFPKLVKPLIDVGAVSAFVTDFRASIQIHLPPVFFFT